METRELTCIGCPMGCQITVELENGLVSKVSGNSCKIGDNYARKEVVAPMRIVTSTVAVEGSDHLRLSVKTAGDVPKSSIFQVMAEINRAKAKLPVKIGDVILENVAQTGVSVVATKNMIPPVKS